MSNTSAVTLVLVEASPLISFLKLDRFDLLEILEKPLACTDFVRAEIQRPRERLDEVLTRGILKEIPLVNPNHLLEVEQMYDRGLGRGEASSIILAEANGYGLIMDDKRAQKVAVARNIELFTTAEIVVRNIQNCKVTLAEADEFIVQWQALGEFPLSVKTFTDLIH